MVNCNRCKYKKKCEIPSCVIATWEKCEAFEPKDSNADRIRSMTDEELAEFFDSGLGSIDFHCEECNNHLNCDVCYLQWLQSEAE